jgi:DNA transformation protein and related proteins
MTRETTYPLYVNLSASQTRKRLKGYGFGVRKVAAADRNQAVIIHTATGDHLRRLQSLFADVLSSPSQEGVGTPIENLRNLGPSSAAWLRGVGVH